MWTETNTLLSLSEWAKEIGINPLIVAQIGEPRSAVRRDLETDAKNCQDVFYQFASQTGDALAREEIAQAIAQAETLIAKYTNTHIAPVQGTEVISYPRDANLAYGQLWYGNSFRRKAVKTQYGNIQSTGVYEETLIQADVAITSSDPLSQGFNTRFSATVTVPAGTTADEIKVYFNASDRLHYELEDMEIRPVQISISGTTATITGDNWLLVKPVYYVPFVPQVLDATGAIYATTFDVYRQQIDLAQSGSLIWENATYLDSGCVDTPCTFELSSGCFAPADTRLGYVIPLPAEYDATLEQYTALCPSQTFAPDRVVLNYISGVSRTDAGLIAQPLRRATALLATALLPNRTCGCARADLRLFHYRQIPLDDSGNLQVAQPIFDAAANTFGVAGRGAIQAFQILHDNEAIVIGKSTNV